MSKIRFYLIDKWRTNAREHDESIALAVLDNGIMPREIAIGPDREFARDDVLIVAHYDNEWRILGPGNETLASIRKDVYAPQVVLRTAKAIIEEASKFRPHAVVTGL